jgi:hypothetical protein
VQPVWLSIWAGSTVTVLRKLVRLQLDQLVELHPRLPDAFFVDWRCRLCRHRAGALDRDTALNEAAKHMQEAHRAFGGQHYARRKK